MSELARVSVRVWMQRLRADENATKIRLGTLLVLGTYMNTDGSNAYVSESKLAADVGISDRAVRDHLSWARENGYLRRTARGHRRGDGSAAESVYEASVPTVSTGTGTPVENDLNRKIAPPQPEDPGTSTGRSEGLNRKIAPPQPEDGCTPYKEDQVLDQLQDQVLTKSTTAGASAKPSDAARKPKPANGMLPMPVSVASPSRGERRRPTPGPPAAFDDTRPHGRGMPPATAIGNQLVAEHTAAYPYKPSREVRQWTSTAVEKQLAQGIDAEMVRIGLALLREDQHANPHRDIGPGLLATYVDRARRGARPGMRPLLRERPPSAAAERQAGFAELRAELAAKKASRPPASSDPYRQTSVFPFPAGNVVEGETA